MPYTGGFECFFQTFQENQFIHWLGQLPHHSGADPGVVIIEGDNVISHLFIGMGFEQSMNEIVFYESREYGFNPCLIFMMALTILPNMRVSGFISLKSAIPFKIIARFAVITNHPCTCCK